MQTDNVTANALHDDHRVPDSRGTFAKAVPHDQGTSDQAPKLPVM